eukprot:TRINITY_DN2007_c0_g1_i4.p1 TRINITY_DN2007_c0_g1~~TRINITY_DN2007_c0_g1_i4.p1  ORF type:complete len:151 (+),score=24.79 TRINITY_DN2007_c0_g1_i4:119-571(+)
MCIRDSINAEYGGTEFKMDLSQRATVAITTSYDERNPPASMLDGFDRSFWATGGMYPQEFVIQLESPSNIDAIRIVSSGIRNLSCEARDASQGNSDFVKVTQETLENAGNQQQSKDIQVQGVRATHLRFIIESGWGDFCAVYRAQITGRP